MDKIVPIVRINYTMLSSEEVNGALPKLLSDIREIKGFYYQIVANHIPQFNYKVLLWNIYTVT